jgi:hypothetical protein
MQPALLAAIGAVRLQGGQVQAVFELTVCSRERIQFQQPMAASSAFRDHIIRRVKLSMRALDV